jgi:hypothetical protein
MLGIEAVVVELIKLAVMLRVGTPLCFESSELKPIGRYTGDEPAYAGSADVRLRPV